MARAQRSWRARVVYLLLLAIFVEVASRATLLAVKRTRDVEYRPIPLRLTGHEPEEVDAIVGGRGLDCLDYDAELGWAPTGACVSDQHVRGARRYSPEPAPGVTRIAAFGDSFTWGNDAADDETWERRIEQTRGDVEVLNYGAGAYGVDQSLLRFEREGARLRPKIVLIGFIFENVLRHVSVYRPFMYPGAFPLTKPRFVLDGGALTLVPNPFARREDYRALVDDPRRALLALGAHDGHFQARFHESALDVLGAVRLAKFLKQTLGPPLDLDLMSTHRVYDPRSESFRVTAAIFDRFYAEATRAAMTPVIVILPTVNDFFRWTSSWPRQYGPLLDHFRARGYRYIDVTDAFAAQPRKLEDLFGKTYHLTPEGNRLAGDAIATWLEHAGLLPPPPSQNQKQK